MTVVERAQRLKIDARLAILDNVSALNRQRKAAVQAGNSDQMIEIQSSIDSLYDQLDELSFLSLGALENSRELKQIISDIRSDTDQLEDEAETILNVADAIREGAKIISQTAEVISKLKGLVSIGS